MVDRIKKKTSEFVILNAKGVYVFINNKWRMQLAKYHSGLQQSARPNIWVSFEDEKWSDSETGKMIDGHNVAIFVCFLRQNTITTHETRTQARI